MLSGLLECHLDVANWSEANQIWDPGWYPWRPEHLSKVPMEFDPAAFTRRWWEETQARTAEIKAVFGAYQWMRRRKFFVNKSPFNSYRIPYLRSIFPEAKFIHLYRDGRAVTFSHARKLSTQGKLQEWPEPYRTKFNDSFNDLLLWLSSYWQTTMEEVRRQCDQLNLFDSGILMEISYEQLCAETQESVLTICDFVGLDSARFTSKILEKRLESQNEKWQKAIHPDIALEMQRKMEPMLSQKGYATNGVVTDRC